MDIVYGDKIYIEMTFTRDTARNGRSELSVTETGFLPKKVMF